MSLSIVLLASAVRLYKRENIRSPITARISLSFSFLFSVSVLPLSLIYLRYLRSITNTSFTLDKLNELPLEKIVGLILIGELSSGFDLATIILVLTGPVLAFLCMLYLLFSKRGNDYRYTTSFFFLAFLILLIDYRVLKLFMEGVPFNEERLWVFRDFLAAPFAALSIYGVVSSLKTLIKKTLPQGASFVSFRTLSRIGVLRVLCLLAVVNVAVPVIAGGWAAVSLNAAYPRIAPLQTTWYELEAATYIERNTEGRYVVICDVWGIYAGEAIVGVNNPRAYYFTEFNRTGNDLFVSMKNEPSSHWLLQAMDLTDTTVAYFIISRPRLGAEEFSAVVSKAMQNGLQVFGPPEGFGNGELYVFAHEKT
jgi:hypothetical protein